VPGKRARILGEPHARVGLCGRSTSFAHGDSLTHGVGGPPELIDGARCNPKQWAGGATFPRPAAKKLKPEILFLTKDFLLRQAHYEVGRDDDGHGAVFFS